MKVWAISIFNLLLRDYPVIMQRLNVLQYKRLQLCKNEFNINHALFNSSYIFQTRYTNTYAQVVIYFCYHARYPKLQQVFDYFCRMSHLCLVCLTYIESEFFHMYWCLGNVTCIYRKLHVGLAYVPQTNNLCPNLMPLVGSLICLYTMKYQFIKLVFCWLN